MGAHSWPATQSPTWRARENSSSGFHPTFDLPGMGSPPGVQNSSQYSSPVQRDIQTTAPPHGGAPAGVTLGNTQQIPRVHKSAVACSDSQ